MSKTRIAQYPGTLKLCCQICRPRASFHVPAVLCSLQCRSSVQKSKSQSWMQGRPADVGSFVKTLEWFIIVLRWQTHRWCLFWSVNWCLWNRLWGLLSGQMVFWGLVTDHQYSKHHLYLHCFQRTLPHCCRRITVGEPVGQKTFGFLFRQLIRRSCSQ